MRLRFAADDRPMFGKTPLDCLRYHCHGDHTPEGRRGDIDGVMKRLADTFKLDSAYASLPTLEERAAAFLKLGLEHGVLVDMSVNG